MAISTKPTGCSFQLTRVRVRAIYPDEEKRWNELMEDIHPLGNAQFAGHRIKYVAEHRNQAVALLCFSGSAYHLADRDRWIGWTPEQAMRRRHFIVQNSRFLILSKQKRQNLASRVLSLCVKQVPQDWRRRFGFAPLLLESFVDPVHFRGTCYKAAGWEQVGLTRGFRRDGQEFYVPDTHPKQIWMKPLQPDACQLLRAPQMPEDWRDFEKELPGKQVAARLGVTGLRSLFSVLQSLPDERRTNGRRYPLGCCLSIVVCAVLAGCEGMRECAEFAATLTQTQLRALRSWKNPKTGLYEAPRTTTLWRTTAGVDARLLEDRVTAWFRDEAIAVGAIAIDGKALRATLHNEDGGAFVVNAVNHRNSPLSSPKNSLTAKARK